MVCGRAIKLCSYFWYKKVWLARITISKEGDEVSNHKLSSILDARVKCPVCGWTGTVGDAEPDVDGDGIARVS